MPKPKAMKASRSSRTKSGSRTGQEDAPARSIRILSVSSIADDHKTLRRILKHSKWHVAGATTCTEAIAHLTWHRVPIVLCESALPDGSWKDILDQVAQYPEPPTLIVTSRLADDYLWAEVLNWGGYDVLAKPFNEGEVRRVIEGASLRRTSPICVRAAAGSFLGTERS